MFRESLEALRRLHRAADKAVRRAVVWGPLVAAALGGAIPARASPTAQLNIDVDIQAIGGIYDLTAVPGTSTGTISLSWTEPYRSAGVAPYSYDVRVSSIVQITNDAEFFSAPLLSAVSPSVPPAPSFGGGAGFVVTGLTQNVTYFFAIREKDSTTFNGTWIRSASPPRNVNNFAVATATRPAAPAAGALTFVGTSAATADWSVSPSATDYMLVASTSAVNPPTSIAASSTTLSSTATVAGLVPNSTYFLFVTACNSGCSAYTAIGSTMTLAAPAVTLSTTAVSTGTVSLAWGANGDPSGTLYRVAQSTDGVAFSTVAASTQTAVVIGGLNSSSTYYYQVIAVNGAGTPAAPSNMVSVLTLSGPPSAPANGSVLSVFVSSVTAAWSPSAGATDYVLVASTVAANPPAAVVASSTTLSSTATVSGLAPNTTYFLFASACGGGGCSPFAAVGSSMTLAAPAVSLSTQAVSSATVSLVWNPNGDPAGTLALIQRSTDGITFATVNTSTVAAGDAAGLTGGVTYYFRVISVNGAGIAAAPSNVLTLRTPSGPTPSAPTGLSAAGGLLNVALAWNGLPPAQQGVGLLYYALSRSLNAAFGYVTIATTTGTSYVDKPLAAGTTYFYKITARDQALTDGAPSAPASAAPYTERPMEPLGINMVPSSAAVTISWSPTGRFVDGNPFLSTGTPTGDELMGYQVFRSTDLCNPNYVQISTLTINTNTLTDSTGGLNYFYRLFSYNSVGASTNVVTLSSLAERNFLLDDCVSDLVMDDQSATTLNGSVNGLGDIRLLRTRRPQDVGNGVLQSAEFHALLNGASEIKNYVLPKPARIVLHFDTLNGKPTPSTSAVNGLSPLASAVMTGGGATVDDLGIYWNNGLEFKKMYGRIDPVAQTVSVQTPNLGIFQIRALARSAGVVFDLSNLSGRVITPNGDGLNDVAIFSYDPGPNGVVPEGKIFDVRGAFVSDMVPGLVPNTLTWNGFMSGLPVHSGVYMYRITGGGKTFTGTIVVAR